MGIKNTFSSLLGWLKHEESSPYAGKETSPKTIMFGDVCGSTKLFETLGDVKAREIVSATIDLMMQAVGKYQGVMIKTIGDEIMCTFDNPVSATLAASEMHKSILNDSNLSYFNIKVKIGLQHGEVLLEDGDVYGDAVNVAARMVSLSKADQIITTRQVRDELPGELRAKTRSYGKLNVKGKQEQMEVIEIIWEEDTSDLTMLPTQMLDKDQMGEAASLTLRYNDIKIEMNAEKPNLVLGRDTANDLAVDLELVSRKHANIELRQGKFVLIDKSTNGTYVITSNGQKFFIHREEMALYGRGIISLGKDINANTTEMIYYKCV